MAFLRSSFYYTIRPAPSVRSLLAMLSDMHLQRFAEQCTLVVLAHADNILFVTQTVIETLAEVIPERQEFAKKLRAEHGDKSLGEIKVENVFGGMRGLKVMLWEPSVLDAEEGIRFWGRSIPECQEVLPKAPGGKQMLPESMLFYLSQYCGLLGTMSR